jgi:hypothetical protein
MDKMRDAASPYKPEYCKPKVFGISLWAMGFGGYFIETYF